MEIPEPKDNLDEMKKKGLYYEVKSKLRLVIDKRMQPNSDEQDLLFQFLRLHGITWEDIENE